MNTANSKKRIGKYIIYLGNKLGKGAFSEVYLGVEEQTKTEVAVKVVDKRRLMEDEYTKNAFYSQIKINKKLKSPNIIKFYDVHQTVNNFYIVLELAEKGTLRSSLKSAQGYRFDQKKTMSYLFQIVSGFGQLVKNGITHRDLKPQNILIKNDELKLADFGFAKQAHFDSFLKTLVGTPNYMAPQILSEEKYTYKCDIWSLGVMTYEMLVGKIPWNFVEKTQEGFRKEIMTREISFPPEIEISQPMKHFIRGCLQRPEKDRFNWDDIFMHPIFKHKFDKHFQNQGSTQLNFILANLRVFIHSRNINLNKLLSKYGQTFNQAEFHSLLAFVQKQISKDEIQVLFNNLAKDGQVHINDFTHMLTKHKIRLTGIDLSKHEMDCEDNSNMKSSKPGIDIFTRLKIQIDSRNIDISKILQDIKLNKSDKLSFAEFGKIIHGIYENASEKELKFMYQEFNVNQNESITFEEFSRGMCKIAEIVPMEAE